MELLVEANSDRQALAACRYRLQDIKLISDPFTQRSVGYSAEDIKCIVNGAASNTLHTVNGKGNIDLPRKLNPDVHTSSGSSQCQT